MSPDDLSLTLLGASLALSLVVAVVALAAAGLAPAVRGALVALALAGAAHNLQAGPALSMMPRAAAPWLLAASAAGVVLLWLLVRLLFEPALAVRRVAGQAAAWFVVGIALPVAASAAWPAARWAGPAIAVVALTLVGHLFVVLLRGRPDDLDPYRRRMRLLLAGGGGLYVAAVLAAHAFGAREGWPFAAGIAQSATQIVFKLAWVALAIGHPSPLQRLYDTSHLKPPVPGSTLPLAAPPPEEEAAAAPAGAWPSVAEAQAARHAERILAAMAGEGLYRQPGLSIGRLADHLGLPEHRVRTLINGPLGFKNYSAFLNHFRLAEVARRLRDPAEAHLPILSIALDVGYGSLAPFNRAFRDAYGCTPSDFRRGGGGASNPQQDASIPESIGPGTVSR